MEMMILFPLKVSLTLYSYILTLNPFIHLLALVVKDKGKRKHHEDTDDIEIPAFKRANLDDGLYSREPSLPASEFSATDSSAFDYGIEDENQVCT